MLKAFRSSESKKFLTKPRMLGGKRRYKGSSSEKQQFKVEMGESCS